MFSENGIGKDDRPGGELAQHFGATAAIVAFADMSEFLADRRVVQRFHQRAIQFFHDRPRQAGGPDPAKAAADHEARNARLLHSRHVGH